MATFTAMVTGLGPFTYRWQRGNQILTKEASSTYTIRNASEEDQNYYRCHVSNINGYSVVSDAVWLQVISKCFSYE